MKNAGGLTLTARALTAGKEYSGPITLFGRLHMATYLPVAFDNGLRGAVFVGIDYNSADPMLALAKQMDYIVIGVGSAAANGTSSWILMTNESAAAPVTVSPS